MRFQANLRYSICCCAAVFILSCGGDPAPGIQPQCGDGIVQAPGEECDDGNLVNTDACGNNCAIAHCGDGFIRGDIDVGEVGFEECDDGNANDQDACLTNCALARCGDGVVGPNENCDDGNQVPDDDCTNQCVSASCGDGVLQIGRGEQCDDGNQDDSDDCLMSCQSAACGDGAIWTDNEACDDGNDDARDACTASCDLAVCGDGIQRTDLTPEEAGFEECDDGNDAIGDGCTPTCAAEICGNGRLDEGEVCDDGNEDFTDDCVACQRPTCGDEHIWFLHEECDDGNSVNEDACTNNCRNAICGDEVHRIDEGSSEECDDGNAIDTDGCRNDCILARCGDNVVNVIVEDCDDGNQIETDACDNDCLVTPSPISASFHVNCLLNSGVPYCMGLNTFGAIGDGTNLSRSVPTRVLDMTNVLQLAGGYSTQCALKGDGTIWCWGHGHNGQLGNGATDSSNRPVQVRNLDSVVEITGGDGGRQGTYFCARRSMGTLWCWGTGYGALAVQVVGINNAVQVSAGRTACARLADGTTWCWGNARGAAQIPGQDVFIEIRVGYAHQCGRKRDGTVWCWGYNSYGQLGDGTTVNRTLPTQVLGLTEVTSLTNAAMFHTCAIRLGGELFCWGYNRYGQLGDGTTISRAIPVRVEGLGVVTHTVVGSHTHSNLARNADGHVFGWGYSRSGSLGTNNPNHLTPQRVQGF